VPRTARTRQQMIRRLHYHPKARLDLKDILDSGEFW
jgi:hypothetical protein